MGMDPFLVEEHLYTKINVQSYGKYQWRIETTVTTSSILENP